MMIKPAVPGNRVRDPISLQLLPDSGAEKPESIYWLRRLRDGDVVEFQPEIEKPKQPKGDKI